MSTKSPRSRWLSRLTGLAVAVGLSTGCATNKDRLRTNTDAYAQAENARGEMERAFANAPDKPTIPAEFQTRGGTKVARKNVEKTLKPEPNEGVTELDLSEVEFVEDEKKEPKKVSKKPPKPPKAPKRTKKTGNKAKKKVEAKKMTPKLAVKPTAPAPTPAPSPEPVEPGARVIVVDAGKAPKPPKTSRKKAQGRVELPDLATSLARIRREKKRREERDDDQRNPLMAPIDPKNGVRPAPVTPPTVPPVPPTPAAPKNAPSVAAPVIDGAAEDYRLATMERGWDDLLDDSDELEPATVTLADEISANRYKIGAGLAGLAFFVGGLVYRRRRKKRMEKVLRGEYDEVDNAPKREKPWFRNKWKRLADSLYDPMVDGPIDENADTGRHSAVDDEESLEVPILEAREPVTGPVTVTEPLRAPVQPARRKPTKTAKLRALKKQFGVGELGQSMPVGAIEDTPPELRNAAFYIDRHEAGLPTPALASKSPKPAATLLPAAPTPAPIVLDNEDDSNRRRMLMDQLENSKRRMDELRSRIIPSEATISRHSSRIEALIDHHDYENLSTAVNRQNSSIGAKLAEARANFKANSTALDQVDGSLDTIQEILGALDTIDTAIESAEILANLLEDHSNTLNQIIIRFELQVQPAPLRRGKKTGSLPVVLTPAQMKQSPWHRTMVIGKREGWSGLYDQMEEEATQTGDTEAATQAAKLAKQEAARERAEVERKELEAAARVLQKARAQAKAEKLAAQSATKKAEADAERSEAAAARAEAAAARAEAAATSLGHAKPVVLFDTNAPRPAVTDTRVN